MIGLKVGNVWTELPYSSELAEDIRRYTRYRTKNYRFSAAYKVYEKAIKKGIRNVGWDGWTFITKKQKDKLLVPSGLIGHILEQAWASQYRIQYLNPPATGDLYQKGVPLALDDLQEEAIQRAIDGVRGVLEVPTGVGKGRAIGETIRRLGLKALVFCDKIDMLSENSLAGEIESVIGEKVGRIGGGTWKEANCTVATYQTLAKNLDAEILAEVPLVICDEVQHAAAATYQNVLQACTGATRRLGFSATAFRDWIEGKQAEKEIWLKVQAFLGPLIYQVSISEAVDSGRIVPPEIFIVHGLGYTIPDSMIDNYTNEYECGIMYNTSRNYGVVQIATMIKEPTVILTTRIEHGQLVAKILDCPFVSGGTPTSERQYHYERFKSGEERVLVVSKIADEALNLPNIGCLILAGGGKSVYLQRQRIGRSLRAYQNKNSSLVFDFADEGKYIGAHYKRRRRAYDAEDAYIVADIRLEEILK